MSEIDNLKSFWDELKERNVVKVVIFYVVAGWAIIQFSQIIEDAFQLSENFTQIVIITLAIGLPVVAVIAWIYELTAEGLQKTDAVPKGKFTKRTGKILNNAITGVLAIAVVLLLVDRFTGGSNSEPVLSETDALAVFPFRIQGDLDEDWNLTVPELMIGALDLIPEINATDQEVLLAELGGKLDNIDPIDAAKLAAKVGANRTVLGTMTSLGQTLQVKLTTYDGTGVEVGEPIIERGSKDSFEELVLRTSQRLASQELERKGKSFNSSAIMTAQNIDAIPPYMESTQLIQEGNYPAALDKIRESITADSTFVLAYAKYLEIAGWLQLGLDPDVRETEYLPNLYRLQSLSNEMASGKLGEIVQAKIEFEKSDIRAERNYNRLLRKYGASTEILMGLAESIFHHREIEARDITDAKVHLERLLEIDSTNKEVLLHLIDIAILEENLDTAQLYFSKLEETGTQDLNREFQLLNIKDTVTDDELLTIANQIDVDDFDFRIKPAMRQINGLKLIERMMELDPILKEYSDFYIKTKLSSTGQHETLVEALFNEYLEYGLNIDIYTLLLDDGYPGLRFFEGKENLIIESVDPYVNNPDVPLNFDLFAQYLQAKMYLASDDLQGFRNKSNALLAYFDDSLESGVGPVSELSRLLYYNLKGFEAHYKKEYQVSLDYIDSAVHEIREIDRVFAVTFSKSRNLFKAENLRLLERYDEAAETYKNLAESRVIVSEATTSGATWGFLVFRLAQMKEQLGDNEEAIKYYKIFLDAYQLADDRYMDWVDNAYKSLSNMLGMPEQDLRNGNLAID